MEAVTLGEDQGSRRGGPRRLLARLCRGRVRVVLVSLGLAYLGILAFPDILFAEQLSYGNFRVASDAPIDPALVEVLERAADKLERSTIYDPAMAHRVYFCESWWRRALLSPTGSGAYAFTRGFFEYTVVLGRVDVGADRIERGTTKPVSRSLSGVLAHERTHALIDRRLGLWASLKCPNWKKEGYCDHIAGDTTFPIDEAKRLIRAGQVNRDPAFTYARACLLIKYLIEVEGRSVDEIFSRPIEEAELLEKIRPTLDQL